MRGEQFHVAVDRRGLEHALGLLRARAQPVLGELKRRRWFVSRGELRRRAVAAARRRRLRRHAQAA